MAEKNKTPLQVEFRTEPHEHKKEEKKTVKRQTRGKKMKWQQPVL